MVSFRLSNHDLCNPDDIEVLVLPNGVAKVKNEQYSHPSQITTSNITSPPKLQVFFLHQVTCNLRGVTVLTHTSLECIVFRLYDKERCECNELDGYVIKLVTT